MSALQKKPIDDFVSNSPTNLILILHFGNGHEEEHISLSKEIEKFKAQYTFD
jgi:hypothetical protein